MHFLHPCIELGIHDTFSEAGRDLAKSEPTKTKHADVEGGQVPQSSLKATFLQLFPQRCLWKVIF